MATAQRKRSGKEHAKVAPSNAPQQVLWLPALLSIALVALSFLPRVQQNSILIRSFWFAALALAICTGVLFAMRRTSNDGPLSLTIDVVLRPQHYVQAAVQLSVYAYWGFFYAPVYAHAWLIVAQLLFAYAFDMLLTWSRRQRYVLGFGAFPIVFSTNLFLWFRDDWFYLQFVMIGVGFLGKEFVRWQRADAKGVMQSTHIFNPSAFTLGLFSLILIATGTSDLTWGQEIASTLTLAPHIYLFLFGIGLVVMYFFSITLIAGTAAATLFGLSSLYFAITGVPYFLDSDIPAAVFLGLHLLVTDPSTSPRSQLGKAIFGALYGCGVFALYTLLNALGAPTFYDKLLCVPLLNLSVIGIDRFVQQLQLEPAPITQRRNNFLFMSAWAAFFFSMTAVGKTDGNHTGDRLPFWEQACAENRSNACARLIKIESSYCGNSSAWACNELGAHYLQGTIVERDGDKALNYFSKACELRLQAACDNLLQPSELRRPSPQALDLRLLLREGGSNLMEMPEPDLFVRACEHGFSFACKK